MQKLELSWNCGLKLLSITTNDMDVAVEKAELNTWHKYRHSRHFKLRSNYQAFKAMNPEFRPEACACDESVL